MAEVIGALVVGVDARTALLSLRPRKAVTPITASSSIAQSASAMSSASVLDMAMQCWRREAELMVAPASRMKKPEVDRVVAQLESA